MSRKTEFKGTAASRRRARRANLQSPEANPFTSGLAMQAQTSNESRSDNSDNVDQKI